MNLSADIGGRPWRIDLSPGAQCAALLSGVLGGAAVLSAAKSVLPYCGPLGVNTLFHLAATVCMLAVLWSVAPRGTLSDKIGLRKLNGRDAATVLTGLAVICLFHLTVSPLWGKLLRALGANYRESQEFIILCRHAGLPRFAALLALAGVLIPVSEELFFRRLMFGIFRPLGALPALLATSLIFAVLHFFLYGFWALWVLGGVFQWVYLRTGNLAASTAAHLIFNCASLTAAFFFGAE